MDHHLSHVIRYILQAEKDKLEGLPADSEEHKSLKDQLRSVVCNSEELKVCCEAQREESDEPAFLPSLEREQCGLGGGTAGFIRQSPTPDTVRKYTRQCALRHI